MAKWARRGGGRRRWVWSIEWCGDKTLLSVQGQSNADTDQGDAGCVGSLPGAGADDPARAGVAADGGHDGEGTEPGVSDTGPAAD